MFRYYLIKGAIETEIPEPVGWDKMESVLKRSPRHGINVEFSEVQLAFYCQEGYEQIIAEYEAEGSDGAMQFRQTYTCDGVTTTSYQANINFNGLVHVPGEYVEANLENVSFGNLLSTREKTKVAMAGDKDIDGNTITPAEPTSLTLHSRAILKQFDATGNLPVQTIITTGEDIFAQKGWDNIIFDEIQTTYHYSTEWQETNPVSIGEWLIDVDEAGVYTFDIEITFHLSIHDFNPADNDVEFRWILRIDSTEYALSNPINVIAVPAPVFDPGVITSTITHTQELHTGQKVYLFAFCKNKSNSVQVTLNTDFPENRINITAETVQPVSSTKAWPVSEVLRQVIYGTTGMPDRFRSEYFAGCGDKYMLTDGFLLRQFPNKSLTVSRNDLYEGLNPVFALGEGLTTDAGNEIVEWEPVHHFYQTNEILRIDYPAEYAEEVAGEYIYNSLEFGYEKSNTDEFNALDEFNSKREYQTPIKSSENRLTFISKFVASMYAIESQRRKPYLQGNKVSGTFDKDTFIITTIPQEYRQTIIAISAGVDSSLIQMSAFADALPGDSVVIEGSADNDGTYEVVSLVDFAGDVILTVSPEVVNIADLTGEVVYTEGKKAEADEPFSYLNNIVSPESMYNGRISPIRNMFRWAGVINSGLWFKDPVTEVLRFVSGEGNTTFEHQFDEDEPCKDGDPEALLISEQGNYTINHVNYGNKLWKPEYITFKAPITAAQMQQIRQAHIPAVDSTAKHGYISVWDGYQYQQGYLLELRFKDANQTEELSSFRLIKKYNSGAVDTHVAFSEAFSSAFN